MAPGGDAAAAGEETPALTRADLEEQFADVQHVTPGQIEQDFEAASGHDDGKHLVDGDWPVSDEVIEVAIAQAESFDDYSADVDGLIVTAPGDGVAFRQNPAFHIAVDPSVLAPSVMRARRVFSDSKLDRDVRNLRRGKIHAGSLAKRVPFGDDRVFKRRLRAEGIDFEVVIGLDVSYSTSDGCIRLIKAAGEALANVLHRVGVDFSLYAHTTTRGHPLSQVMNPVKRVTDPWGPQQQELLARLSPVSGSLDGHNLEFYRKLLQRSRARQKLIVYFTDGQIPDTNRAEEKVIIEREVKMLDRLGYSFLAVGIGNDSPKKYGLDTIRIDQADDIVTVVKEIEKRITH